MVGLALIGLAIAMVLLGSRQDEGFGALFVLFFSPLIAAIVWLGAGFFRAGRRAAQTPPPPDPWAHDPELDGPEAEDR